MDLFSSAVIRRLLVICLGLGLWSIPGAQAQDASFKSDVYLGGLLGISSGNNGLGTGVGFGINAGYFFDPGFGIGGALKNENFDNDISANVVAIEGLYRLTDTLPGLHLGVNLGSARFTFKDQPSDTSLAYGGKAVYDYILSYPENVSLGLDVSVVFTEPGSQLLTLFTPMATAKIWF